MVDIRRAAVNYDPFQIGGPIEDDLLTGTNTTGGLGVVGLHAANLTTTVLAAEYGHPGAYRGAVAATNPTTGAFHLRNSPTTGVMMPDEPFDLTWIVRCRLAGGAKAQTIFRIGVNSDPSNVANGTDGLYFECLGADTNWFAVQRGAGVDNRVDTGIAFVDTTYMRFRIQRVSANPLLGVIFTIYRVVSGAVVATSVSNAYASGPVNVPVQPCVMVRTTEAVAKHVDVDYVRLFLTGQVR